VNETAPFCLKSFPDCQGHPVCSLERDSYLQGWCEHWQGICALRSRCLSGCFPEGRQCELPGYSLVGENERSPRKVLFLDFDDVLNTAKTLDRGEMFERANLDALNLIIDNVDVDIVITSVWRLAATIKELEEILVQAGVNASGRVIGSTPWLQDRSRGEEIMAWLRTSPVPVSRFAILDDRCDMEACCVNLVRTDPLCGLLPTQAEEIVTLLNY